MTTIDEFLRVQAADSRDHRKPRLFYPTVGGGKYHEATEVMGHAHCRQNVELDTTTAPIHVMPGEQRVHPIVCRRCLNRKTDESPFKISSLPKTQTCKWCSEPATKRVLWAEGMAYIPTCEAHFNQTKNHIEHTNADEVAAVHDIPKVAIRFDNMTRTHTHDDGSAFQPDDEVTLYHETSAERAAHLREHGTAHAKPVGENTTGTEYEPGREMGKGLYLSNRPHSGGGVFGDTVVPVRVKVHELAVPPERAHRIPHGMTPLKSLMVGDGYTEAHLGPERFGEAGKVAHVLTDWSPTERIFAPTKDDLDPRLFSEMQMLPKVRSVLIRKMVDFLDKHFTTVDWTDWCRMYLAGSEASLWWGNNDFDILVGINYDGYRKATGDTLADEQITDDFNAIFRVDWNDENWHPSFDPDEEWHLTGYVNHNSWDIRRIKPYAAYEVISGTWFVEPLSEPQGHHFTESEFYLFEGVAEKIRHLLTLPEPERTVRAMHFYDELHRDRSRAFGPDGAGIFDRGNALEKYLDQAGLWAPLQALRYGDKTAGSLAPFPSLESLTGPVAGDPDPHEWQRWVTHLFSGHDLESLREIGRQSIAAEGGPCKCCGGSGEHRTGRECYGCDASGQWSGYDGPIPCDGTKPYGTDNEGHQVELDPMDGWQHLDGSVSHDDATTVSDHPVKHDQGTWPDVMPKTGRKVTRPGEDRDGIMIAIVPPASIVEDLVLEDGEDPADFHVTLAFLGKITNYTEDQIAALPGLIRDWAKGQPKMDAKVQGVGTFVNESNHVLWASVDIPGVTKMHVSLVEYLTGHGFGVAYDHAFVPHMTLAYGKHHFRFMPKIDPAEFKVREVWVCIGEQWESFGLARKR